MISVEHFLMAHHELDKKVTCYFFVALLLLFYDLRKPLIYMVLSMFFENLLPL